MYSTTNGGDGEFIHFIQFCTHRYKKNGSIIRHTKDSQPFRQSIVVVASSTSSSSSSSSPSTPISTSASSTSLILIPTATRWRLMLLLLLKLAREIRWVVLRRWPSSSAVIFLSSIVRRRFHRPSRWVVIGTCPAVVSFTSIVDRMRRIAAIHVSHIVFYRR